ncbi:unnamed protein product [Effrenium voratum]|nr:unnamed protein product [Effrenium voratum]
MEVFTFWLRADLVAICLAVWAPTSVFLEDVRLWLLQLGLALAVCGSTYGLCDGLAGSKESELKTLDRNRMLRTIVNSAFFVWCLILTGIGAGFQHLWVIGALLYGISFFLAPPFARKYPDMPWHFQSLNGWQEDFHVTVALADLAFIIMAYQVVLAAE